MVGEIGGNDYNFAFFGNRSMGEVEKLVPGVVQTIIDATKVYIPSHIFSQVQLTTNQ